MTEPRVRPRQRGISLIEVMVAVLILAFALVGLAMLQTRSLKSNVSAIQRTQATMVAQYALEVLRADRANAKNFVSPSGYICVATAVGTSTSLAKLLKLWMDDMKAAMGRADDPHTCARITCSDFTCTVDIRWDDSAAGGAADEQLSLQTRI